MPAQFKEILKQTKPYYQQGAPLLLEAHAIYEDAATGKLIAQLKWRNLSHQTVQAVNVSLHCKDSFGATLEASTYQYMDVSAVPQGFFGTQNAIPLVSERTRQCVVSITGVSFVDGSVWSATEEDTCVALPDGKTQTLTGDLLSQFEQDVAGKGFGPAVKFIPQTYEDLWQCGCGHWQKQGDDTCASCKATMAQLIELSEPIALAERLTAYQQQQEEKRIEQEKKNEALKKEQAIANAKAKKRNILIASVLTVAVAAVLFFTQVIQPKQKYEAAVALMESGQYEEASLAFAELGQYSDAAERVNEPFYVQAEELLADGQYDDASAAFTKAGDYSNAADRIGEPYYVQAEALLANGEYDAATNAFNMAGSYSDASERAGKTRYAQAEALLADGQYEAAATAFAKAGDYNDAVDRVKKTYYTQAEALLADGQYEEAAAAFTKAGDYSDAVDRVKKTHYTQAATLLANGQYEEAIAAFAALGDYSDSPVQVTACEEAIKYNAAKELYAAGKYEEAYTAFTALMGYKDVATLLATDENMLAVVAAAARREPFTKVGNYVTYGRYEQDNNQSNGQEAIEWLVLAYDEKTNRSLLISRYGLDALDYDYYILNPTWEKSNIRKWLNNYFLNAAFTTAEQAAIATVTISTPSLDAYHDGGPDTEDQIWLLSTKEAITYFENDDDRKAELTSYAKENGARDDCWWWLRSPGYTHASNVTPDGSINYKLAIHAVCAVRPAFWLDLSSL